MVGGQWIWNMSREEYDLLCGQQMAAAQYQQQMHNAYWEQMQQNTYVPPDWDYMKPNSTTDDGTTIDGECTEVATPLLLGDK